MSYFKQFGKVDIENKKWIFEECMLSMNFSFRISLNLNALEFRNFNYNTICNCLLLRKKHF